MPAGYAWVLFQPIQRGAAVGVGFAFFESAGYAFEHLLATRNLAAMSFIIYLLIGLMPGDPIDMLVSGNPRMTSEDAKRLR